MAKVARRDPAALVKFTLRMDEAFHNRLERAAAKSGRTLNFEILERLQASFSKESQALEQAELIAEVKKSILQAWGDMVGKVIIDERDLAEFREMRKRRGASEE